MIVQDCIERLLVQWAPAEPLVAESAWSLQSVYRFVYGLLSVVYSQLFVRPLALLYFYGPQWHGFGMWAGTDPQDICARMTGAPSLHWQQHMDDCHDLLVRDFYSFLLLVEFLFALLVLYRLGQWCWYYSTEPIQTRQYLRLLERQHQLETEKLVLLLRAKDEHPYHTLPSPSTAHGGTHSDSYCNAHCKPCYDVPSGKHAGLH